MEIKSPVFITVSEAAALLQVNPRHIKNMIKAGKLKGKNLSVGSGKRGLWRVLYDDVVKLKG